MLRHFELKIRINVWSLSIVLNGIIRSLDSGVLGNTIDTGDDHSNPTDDVVITPASSRVAKKLMRLLGCSISASRSAFPESESGWFPTFFD